MSQLLDFYRGNGRDSEQRKLSEILNWDDSQWETVHDFIQWVFPLDEPSSVNADAPLVTAADIKAFAEESLLISNMGKSFGRFLVFLGLEWTINEQIIPEKTFKRDRQSGNIPITTGFASLGC